MALEVYVKSRAKTAGTPCGDAFWYAEQKHQVWLLVVDGLGSGPEAAAAALMATECVRGRVGTGWASPAPPNIPSLLEAAVAECDRALRRTRGAALGIGVLDANRQTGYFLGVGNVEMRAIGSKAVHPVGVPGIVGAGVRRTNVERFSYQAGDLIVMHSDGLSSRFDLDAQIAARWRVESLGDKLVREHGKAHDDMTVILLRQYA